jgi:hypothetical protein
MQLDDPKALEASTRFGNRWWQATLLASLGIALSRIQGWPTGDGVAWLVSVVSACLLYPLLEKSAGILARICRVPERWRPGVATVISLAAALAMVEGIHSLSWRAATHRLVDVLPGAIGVAIGAAFSGTRKPEAAPTRRTPAFGLIVIVLVLGLGFGYLAGTTSAQEQLDGTMWVWRRAILVACFTWITVGGLIVLQRRPRPAA